MSREEWAGSNLDTLSDLLDPVAARLESRLEFAGPLAGALRLGAGATLAAEAGLVMGYASTRVLGQYELSLLPPERDPRLLYVAPNLDRAVRQLDVDRESFFGWIVIHELTHAFQFQGVSWLRDHLRRLIREYLDTVEVRIESGAAGGLPSLPSPARIVEAFREGGLAALVQTREQRELMDRVQAAMAVIEGYAEHVMDALGPGPAPGLRRPARCHGAPAQQPLGARSGSSSRLLGMDLKMRQYELGRAFCDEVASARRHGGAEPRLGVSGGASEPRGASSGRAIGWPAARLRSPPRNRPRRAGLRTCVRWYTSTELRTNKIPESSLSWEGE